MLFLLLVSLVSFPLSAAFCPDGAYFEPNSARCIQTFTERVNFTLAEANCQLLGGHLVSIHNAYENVHIQDYAGKVMEPTGSDGLWIGYNLLNNVSNWQWTDGTTSSYTNWRYNNPANSWLEQCTSILGWDGLWNSDACYSLNSYICEVPTTSVPPTGPTIHPPMCLNGWNYLASTDFCYFVNQEADTPTNHDAFCQLHGARLASVHSSEENDFIYQINQNAVDWPMTCYKYDVYIALGTDGSQTTWMDGTPLDYVNYVPGNDINNGTKFCYMQGTKKAGYPKQWYAEPCTYSVCGVCKMKAVH